MNTRKTIFITAVACLSIGLAGGYGWHAWRAGGQDPSQRGQHTLPVVAAHSSKGNSPTAADRKVLYWYDPMVPQQHFDKPGKSPFMDMQLVPKYADNSAGSAGAATVAIDPRVSQALGWRTETVQRRTLGVAGLQAVGTVQLNEREVAIEQARAGGFVERVARLAPGDVVSANALIAEVLVPEWAGAQQEFLAVRASGDAVLTAAARQRLKLLGMPEALVRQVETSGKLAAVTSVTAPIGGLLEELTVRQGMTLSPGMTLARINGLNTVWVEAAVPQAQQDLVQVGLPVQVLPGEGSQPLQGKVAAILAQTNSETRTVRVRIELPNPGQRLRAGMFVNVAFHGEPSEALVVPSEAVIRTGRRSIVYVAQASGRFAPVEVETGGTDGEMTVVRHGLQEGQQIVASGQFLLDSEASMQGLVAKPAASAESEMDSSPGKLPAKLPAEAASSAATTYTTQGTITAIDPDSVTLDHAAVPALRWDPMTMGFAVADHSMLHGRKVGERVTFSFTMGDDGPRVQSIKPLAVASKPGAAR